MFVCNASGDDMYLTHSLSLSNAVGYGLIGEEAAERSCLSAKEAAEQRRGSQPADTRSTWLNAWHLFVNFYLTQITVDRYRCAIGNKLHRVWQLHRW